MKHINHVFKCHPKVDEVFVTTDNQIFFRDNDADNHAKELGAKKDKVTKVTRSEAEAKKDESEMVLPEGEPHEDWLKDELHLYMNQKEIGFLEKDTKKELVAKIEEAKKED